jgi:hypothetical protein
MHTQVLWLPCHGSVGGLLQLDRQLAMAAVYGGAVNQHKKRRASQAARLHREPGVVSGLGHCCHIDKVGFLGCTKDVLHCALLTGGAVEPVRWLCIPSKATSMSGRVEPT